MIWTSSWRLTASSVWCAPHSLVRLNETSVTVVLAVVLKLSLEPLRHETRTNEDRLHTGHAAGLYAKFKFGAKKSEHFLFFLDAPYIGLECELAVVLKGQKNNNKT